MAHNHRPLTCCGGVEYDNDGRRWEVHDVRCRLSVTYALLMEEGVGMAGRDYPEVFKMRISMDCETGGLDPQESPLLHLTLWQPDGPCFDVRVKAMGKPCHSRALEANGLNPEEGDYPNTAAQKLVDWWKSIGSPRFHLVGQNVGSFDVPFAKQLCGYGVDVPWSMMFDYHYLDTATMAFALQQAGIFHFGKWSLANICQVLGILYDPHLAKADAQAAWHAWHRMEAVLKHLRLNSEALERGMPNGCSLSGEVGNHGIRAHLLALDLRS